MYEYLSGKLTSLTPATAVIDCGGVGYLTEITLNTYSAIQEKQEVRLWIHEVIREDAYLLYGFFTEAEREMFRLLIGVNGVGAATARMMLSSLTADEIRQAILSEDVNRIKSIKGIGAKSAQRVILELKDKIVKGAGAESAGATIFAKADNAATVDEATTALVMLGFSKANIAKVIPAILKENPSAKVEDIIKAALQRL